MVEEVIVEHSPLLGMDCEPEAGEGEGMSDLVGIELARMFARSRKILRAWERLHTASVTIGRLESIADSGVVDQEIQECQALVAEADRMAADIDRLLIVGVDKFLSQQEAGDGLR